MLSPKVVKSQSPTYFQGWGREQSNALIGGYKRRTKDACPPLGPISFIFMPFSEIFGQIIDWRPHLGGR